MRVQRGEHGPHGARPDDGSQPPQATDQATPSPESSRSPTRDAIKIAVVGAVATVVTTALLSGGTWRSVIGWFGEDAESASQSRTTDSSGPSASTSTAPVAMKTVRSSDGAITLQVPTSWGYSRAGWNLDFAGFVDPGSALRAGAGEGVSSTKGYSIETYYLGASAGTAERLGLPGRDEKELRTYLTTLVRYLDWTIDGCVLEEEGELDVDGYLTVFRRWSGCAGFSHMSMWEVFAVTTSGDLLVSSQLQTGEVPVEGQRELLTGWLVRPERIPSGEPRKVKPEFAFPPPPWMPTPHPNAVP